MPKPELPPLMLGEQDDMVEHLLDRVDDLIALGVSRKNAEMILADVSKTLQIGDNPDERWQALISAQGMMMIIGKKYRSGADKNGVPFRDSRKQAVGLDGQTTASPSAPAKAAPAKDKRQNAEQALGALAELTDSASIEARMRHTIIRDINEIEQLDRTAKTGDLLSELARASTTYSLGKAQNDARSMLERTRASHPAVKVDASAQPLTKPVDEPHAVASASGVTGGASLASGTSKRALTAIGVVFASVALLVLYPHAPRLAEAARLLIASAWRATFG